MIRIVPLFLWMAASPLAFGNEASPLTLFSAERDCTAMPTINSIRYTIPCRLNPVQTRPAPASFVDEQSTLRALTFLQRLRVNFICESIYPLNLKWKQLPAQAFGDIAARADGYALATELVSVYQGTDLEFTMAGFQGMQFMKPGCQAELISNVLYPQPSSLNLYLRLVTRQSRTLGTIFSSVTLNGGTRELIDALTQAEDALDLLTLGADPVTLVQIEETLATLRNAKSSLSQSCGAGSGAELCSAQQAAVREAIQGVLKDIDLELKTAERFLLDEETRLQSSANMNDIRDQLKTMRERYFPAP
jgi:hypothetical protein